MEAKKKIKIATIGGATQDIFFHSPEGELIDNKGDVLRQKLVGFEYGAKINIPEALFGFGGGAVNSGICLSRLGMEVASYISVGGDNFGEAIVSNLEKENINIEYVQKNKKASGLSCVIVYGKKTTDHVLFTYRGANEELKVEVGSLSAFDPDWIYVSSLSGRHFTGVLNKVFSYAKKHKKKVAWNPGNLQLAEGTQKLKPYLKDTSVLILNRDEATELVMKEKKVGVINPRKLVFELSKLMSDGIAVVTDGDKGAHGRDRKKNYFYPVKKVRMSDTTGVGDAFGSTFVWGLEYFKGDIKAALEVATINAGAVISKQGAQNGLLRAEQLIKKL